MGISLRTLDSKPDQVDSDMLVLHGYKWLQININKCDGHQVGEVVGDCASMDQNNIDYYSLWPTKNVTLKSSDQDCDLDIMVNDSKVVYLHELPH